MIESKKAALAFAAVMTFATTAAYAQSAPQTKQLTVKYSGVVTNDATDTIMIRQPDGTLARYQGTVPNFEYKKGDNVTISFNTTVPTKAYYDANSAPKSTDGIYRFFVQGQLSGGGPFGIANDFDISGSYGSNRYMSGSGIVIVYDSNVDAYSLEMPDGSFALGRFFGPSFLYDAATGALLPIGRNCFSPFCSEDSGAEMRGNLTDITMTQATGRYEPNVNPEYLGNSGTMSLGFKGSWNLPTYEPTQVPEPASIGLFAGGLALLGRARRRKHRLQS